MIVSFVMKLRTLTLACALAAASSTGARADDAAPPPPAAAGDTGTDQATLPKGRAVIDAFVEIGLNSAGGKPFSIAPDIWYGVTDAITIGLVHSFNGETGFIGGAPGSSLCFSGSGTCKVYNNVGFDFRYKLKSGTFSWAFDGGLFFDELSPDVFLDLKLGAIGRWHKDKIALELEPALYFALTNRTADDGMGNSVTVNPDILDIPVTGFYSISPKFAVALQLGLELPFESTSDTYRVVLAPGIHYLVTEHFNVTAAFSFDRLIGGGNAGAADFKSITIGGSYAL